MNIIGIQKFSAVIIDTVSIIKATWKIIEGKYFNIIYLRCNSYIINLLIRDILIIDEIKVVVNNAKMIINYFKSHI